MKTWSKEFLSAEAQINHLKGGDSRQTIYEVRDYAAMLDDPTERAQALYQLVTVIAGELDYD